MRPAPHNITITLPAPQRAGGFSFCVNIEDWKKGLKYTSKDHQHTNMKRDISTLTIDEVDTAIRVLAAESPDFVYNTGTSGAGCYYHKEVLGGEPNKGCIFGQAFQRLGVDMSTIGGDDISNLWSETHEVTSPYWNCPEEWEEVQNIQDNGGTWGEAIQKLPPVGQHTA